MIERMFDYLFDYLLDLTLKKASKINASGHIYTGSSPVYSIEKIKQEDFARCYDCFCLKKVNQMTAEKILNI